jgi:hypothetical protein
MKISLSHFTLLAFIRRRSTALRRRYFILSSRLVMWVVGDVDARLINLPCHKNFVNNSPTAALNSSLLLHSAMYLDASAN